MKQNEGITNNDEAIELRESIFEFFNDLKDSRVKDNKKHNFLNIIFILLCGVISGVDNLSELMTFIEAKSDWLMKVLEISSLPSRKTFWWILVRMNPEEFHKCFVNWMKNSIETEIKAISIDGKQTRGTKRDEGNPLHIVTACASELGLILAQEKTEDKSNEIKAIPRLLKCLDLSGAIVTIDAMGCQKNIAKQVREQGGDYLLSLKGNQSTLHEDVKTFFESEPIDKEYRNFDEPKFSFDISESIEKDHGRIELRRVRVTSDIGWLTGRSEWKDLNSIIEVYSERTIQGEKSAETRYYISSRLEQAETLAIFIRSHWEVENGIHWLLDVAFADDVNQMNTGHAAENISLLKRLALNLLKLDKSSESMLRKRKRAGWNEEYLLKILRFIK